MLDVIKTRKFWLATVLVGAAALIGVTVYGPKAKAADKGGPKAVAGTVVDLSQPSWTAFGGEVHGSFVDAFADSGSPINLSMSGQTAGVGLYYRHQFGVLVVGADVNYDRMLGDLHDFGIDGLYSIGLSAGLLPAKSTLAYTKVRWLRAHGSGENIDGWGFGGGVLTKVTGTPLSLGLEVMHDKFEDKFGPSVDLSATSVMLKAQFDFYNKPIPSIFQDR